MNGHKAQRLDNIPALTDTGKLEADLPAYSQIAERMI